MSSRLNSNKRNMLYTTQQKGQEGDDKRKKVSIFFLPFFLKGTGRGIYFVISNAATGSKNVGQFIKKILR